MNKETIDKNIIDFVQKTTEAITIISESTRAINITLTTLKELNIKHENETMNGFKMVEGKIESLKMIFFYVILPLLAGVFSLVGVKFLFQMPK